MAKKRIFSPEQDIAANPTENVWVQANAGTGKTTVLVGRLLRILFRSPSLDNTGILCLTYTNAGAGEMRNRILRSLREWAMADDSELADLLSGITTGPGVSSDDLSHARQIFYKYIDNPDLLKIKTIHGFCEEILRRFPIEAGLSPAWTLVSDDTQRVLLQDAFEKLLNFSGADKNVQAAFDHVIERVSEYSLDNLLQILSAQYKHFFQINDIVKCRKYFIDTIRYFLQLDINKNTDMDVEKLRNIVKIATDTQNSLKKPVKYLDNIINLTRQYIDNTIDFEKYKFAYLNKDGTPDKKLVDKDFLTGELDRVYTKNQYNINKRIFDDTVALFDLSAAFATVYGQIKQKRNLLDFEDLILYTRRLFMRPDVMGWVLSQLNVSLSHILVDEAQDTSPAQWDILRMLAGDFFTDGDASDIPHALFVVGDTKQSIFSFQNADPHAFISSRDEIARQIKNNMRTIREIPLTQSFRSAPAILNTVDEFFDNEYVRRSFGFMNNAHKCFRDAPGLVELNSLVSKKDSGVDVRGYIRTIADKIQSLINNQKYSADDIMVLVQRREPMAPVLLNELKRRGIPVAGSDRVVLPDFPAIRDLMNLVRFCINTADDYSLCCVLKSPLFRLTERDIFKICDIKNRENKSRKNADENYIPMTVFDVLCDTDAERYSDLEKFVLWAKNLAPYSFFSQVLNYKNIRASMIAALGVQIIDPLEEFMTICLAYERTQPGTIREFLKWFVTGASEIKRDMDTGAGVRIVTVHGAKGLEAPVVFLIDTVTTDRAEQLLNVPRELLSASLQAEYDKYPAPWIWSPHSGESAARTCLVDANARVQNEEYYRLLYVAMTRAMDQLYIYGYYTYANAPENAWHSALWRVLSASHPVVDNKIRITNG